MLLMAMWKRRRGREVAIQASWSVTMGRAARKMTATRQMSPAMTLMMRWGWKQLRTEMEVVFMGMVMVVMGMVER